jgi:hypothetical protein
MPILPIAPPQPVLIYSVFDYVTVDASRPRVYAAHTGSSTLLIVDADSGLLLGQVRTGAIHGVAVDPLTGHVYTGSSGRVISDVDPTTLKVVREVTVDGPVDAVAYDPGRARIYADEDDGTRIFVVDSTTFQLVATIKLRGHKPEYLTVDPDDHDLYQNIADLDEYVDGDGQSLAIKSIVNTPELLSNHPLQFDSAFRHVLVGGKNGVLSTYTEQGRLLSKTQVQPDIDQCSLEQTSHVLACAGGGLLTAVQANPDGTTAPLGPTMVPQGVHTVGIDDRTGRMWVVWGSPNGGDCVQSFALSKERQVACSNALKGRVQRWGTGRSQRNERAC